MPRASGGYKVTLRTRDLMLALMHMDTEGKKPCATSDDPSEGTGPSITGWVDWMVAWDALYGMACASILVNLCPMIPAKERDLLSPAACDAPYGTAYRGFHTYKPLAMVMLYTRSSTGQLVITIIPM